MAPKRPRISRSDAAPVQWEDLPRDTRAKTRAAFTELGKTASSRVDKSLAGFDKIATESNSEQQRDKARRGATSLREYARVIKDIPITLQRAANRRTAFFGDAVAGAVDSGASNPRGWGWYYEHREGVDLAAPNVSPEIRSAASAGMSPQADPKSGELPDLKSVHDALQDPYAVRTVKPGNSPDRKKARKAAGVVIGQELKVSEATTQELVTTDIGKGVMQNLGRGIGAIRGELSPEEVNRAPKTKTYQAAIHSAVPFTDVSVPLDKLRAGEVRAGEGWTPERLDYMQIGSHVVHGDPNQGMFLFSKSSPGPLSKHSMMSVERSSPQDTWMEAISTGQDMSIELSEGSLLKQPPSPAKRVIDKGAPLDASPLRSGPLGITVAEVGKTGVTPEDVRHAFHDKATRVASKKYGRVSHNQFGEDIFIPSVAMQETTWNEARAVAGGDADFNAEMEQKAKANKTKPPTQKALREEERANPRLFSVEPGGMTAGENTRAVQEDQERRRKDKATDD